MPARGRRGRRGRWVVVLALALGCGRSSGEERKASETQSSSPAAGAPPVCGRVLFVHTRGEGPATTTSIAAAGSSSVALSVKGSGESPEVSRFPAAVSADGQRLLVLRSEPQPDGKTRDGLEWVCLRETFGEVEPIALRDPTAERPLTGQIRNPAWSPDGRFIVFESDAHSFRDLYRYDLDSGAVRRLTDDVEGNFEPSISPDSRRVAFVSSREGNAEVYVMGADGATQRRLTDSPGDDTNPLWSPDGEMLAFISARDRERGLDVYLTKPDGSATRPLTAGTDGDPVIARDLAFSPDGSRLALTRVQPGGGATVGVFEVHTGRVVFETPRAAGTVDEQPAWSPDGRFLVFSRGRAGGESNLVRVEADGTGATPLTDAPGSEWLPRWVADQRCGGT